MSNPRLGERLSADGPVRAARPGPAAPPRHHAGSGAGEAGALGDVEHPVLREVLRQLREREARATGPLVAYYEDSP